MSTAKAPAAPSDRICEKILPGQYLKNIALLTKRVEYTILFWPPKALYG